jgi:hypothetical protein
MNTQKPTTQSNMPTPQTPVGAGLRPALVPSPSPATPVGATLVSPASHPNPLPPDSPPFPISEDLLSAAPDLSHAQLAAIEMLVIGTPLRSIAHALHIDRKTLYNWRAKDEDFRAHFRLRREETHGQVTDHYRSLLIDTLNILFQQTKHHYPPTAHKAAHSLIALSRIGYDLNPSKGDP